MLYQKKTSNIFIALAFTLSLMLGFLVGTYGTARADDVAELQRQIDARNENIKKLENEIKLYQQEADKTGAKAKTLQNAIKTLEINGKKLDTDIKLTQAKITNTNVNINKISLDINDKEKRIQALNQSVSESLRIMHQTDDTSFIESVLNTKSLVDGLNTFDLLQRVQDAVLKHTTDLASTKQNLEKDKNNNEEKKDELQKFVSTLDDQKKVVLINKQEQSKLLTTTKNDEATYNKIVKDKAALKAQFEKELFDYEAKLKYTLDPSKLPTAGSSPFAWPTDNVYITQQFGKTSASGRLYASGSHNGVDFKALMGTPVKALASGTVVGTGDTDASCPRASFGKWVLIRYSNGLSAIFGHLSVIKVNEGDQVKTGDVVAYSGNTGYSTGPHLHVSVYASDAVTVQNRPSLSCAGKILRMPISAVNAYLDPMLYFPKL